MKEPQFISKAGLIGKRNWTEKLVNMFMPHPDKEAENPHYKSAPPMKLYSLDRVERIEQTERFKEAYRSASRNKAAGKEAAETKRNKLMTYVQTVVINIPVLEKDSLIFQACASYNHHNSYRRQYVEGGEDFEPATPNSDHGFLQRITLNYIRHNLTRYHVHLEQNFGKVGNDDAYEILKMRVNAAIYLKYPYLNPQNELYENTALS